MFIDTRPVINCTPHDINLYDSEGKNVIDTYPRSEYEARCEQEPQKQIGWLTTPSGRKVPVFSEQKFGAVTGLPICEEDDCPGIIVSMVVGNRLKEVGSWPGRVYGPDTGKGAVREKGRIIGTKCLVPYFDPKKIVE